MKWQDYMSVCSCLIPQEWQVIECADLVSRFVVACKTSNVGIYRPRTSNCCISLMSCISYFWHLTFERSLCVCHTLLLVNVLLHWDVDTYNVLKCCGKKFLSYVDAVVVYHLLFFASCLSCVLLARLFWMHCSGIHTQFCVVTDLSHDTGIHVSDITATILSLGLISVASDNHRCRHYLLSVLYVPLVRIVAE